MIALSAATDPAVRRRYDLAATTIGGVAVLSRTGPDMLQWCQALGFTRTPSPELIDEIVAHYRARGVEAARFALPATAETPEWQAIVAEHGLTVAHAGLRTAVRSPFPSFEPRTDLRTALITPQEREQWASLMWETFDMATEAAIALTMDALKDPGFEAYACYDGDRMVATGMIWLGPGVGHLSGGATLAAYRGRGAQQALLAARVEAGRRAGCAFLVNEGSVDGDGYSVSLRNQIRVGFVPQYVRRYWVWTAGPARAEGQPAR